MKTKAWTCVVGAALAVAGCCSCKSAREVVVLRTPGETPAAFLERVRTTAADAREKDPFVRVGAGAQAGCDDFTRAFAGFGEAEEIDFWCVPATTGADDVAALRKLFDGAGGKQVEIRAGGKMLSPSACDPALSGVFGGPSKPAGEVLAAASGRVFVLDAKGRIVWERRGCGNVHRAQAHDGWIYYSNGDLWRLPRADAKAKPERVYRAADRAGAAVLGFDVGTKGELVLALNNTSEIVELDGKTFAEKLRFKVDCRDDKGATPPPHGRLRFVRKTPKGSYLVCCASAAKVREYDAAGKCIWEQAAPPFVFDALVRANGNVLVSHLTGLTEFSRDHKSVWTFTPADVPEAKLAMLCGVQELAGGDLVVGTWANGSRSGEAATAAQIGRDKALRWCWYARGDVNMMSARVETK